MLEPIPYRQTPCKQNHTRQKNSNNADRTTEPCIAKKTHRCPQKTSEGKQRPGHCLRGTISCQKSILAHHARVHRARLQQGQHHMAATKHQCPGTEQTSRCLRVSATLNDHRHNNHRHHQ